LLVKHFGRFITFILKLVTAVEDVVSA